MQELGHGLDDRGVWVSIPGRGKSFPLLHSIQIGSVPHPALFTKGAGTPSPVIVRQGREADHSPPSNAEV
jgi:hypothetical protein